MKICFYSRVSTNYQSNENQKLQLEKYAHDLGVAFNYFEETESSRNTRPVKAMLLNKLREKEYDCVVVCKLDRWARSSRELITEIDEFSKKAIGFISISDNIDFTTAAGMLHFHILAAFAQFERSLISQRTREGLARLRKEGRVKLGRPRGSKDKNGRSNKGYLEREEQKRQKKSLSQTKGE
jgi:DNA invertase Pin-like site-specific DNA recombinase